MPGCKFEVIIRIQKYKLDLVVTKIVFNNQNFSKKAVTLQALRLNCLMEELFNLKKNKQTNCAQSVHSHTE